jgi:hypothetical protein
VQYRTTKPGRLDLTTAAFTPALPAGVTAVLKLQPYMTTTGVMFDPSILGNTFTGTGIYTLTLNGAPAPACANPNGTYTTHGCTAKPIIVIAYNTATNAQVASSAPTALTNIRT